MLKYMLVVAAVLSMVAESAATEGCSSNFPADNNPGTGTGGDGGGSGGVWFPVLETVTVTTYIPTPEHKFDDWLRKLEADSAAKTPKPTEDPKTGPETETGSGTGQPFPYYRMPPRKRGWIAQWTPQQSRQAYRAGKRMLRLALNDTLTRNVKRYAITSIDFDGADPDEGVTSEGWEAYKSLSPEDRRKAYRQAKRILRDAILNAPPPSQIINSRAPMPVMTAEFVVNTNRGSADYGSFYATEPTNTEHADFGNVFTPDEMDGVPDEAVISVHDVLVNTDNCAGASYGDMYLFSDGTFEHVGNIWQAD
jgi:hypothetical protein